MTFLLLKSFIPEFFLSFCILFQFIYNALLITDYKKSFPVITKEVFFQTLFILICLFFLLLNLKSEVYFLNFLFVNDLSSVTVKLFIILVSICLLFLIAQNFNLQKLNFFEYFLLYLLAILSLLLLINSADMLSAYLLIEMQALCFYILTAFNRDSSFSTEAGLKYFLAGSFISGIFLAGCSVLYGLLGTLNFNHLSIILSSELDTSSFFYVGLLFGNILILITFLFKVAAAPFHYWAPDVYEGAPLASTIIFSTLPKVPLIYFFLKWFLIVEEFFPVLFNILEGAAILSLIVGISFALQQKRIKRLMIYSSIGQLGFVLAALAVPTLNSLISIFFFLVIYVLSSFLFWLQISSFYGFQKRIRIFYLEKLSPLFLVSFSGFFKINKAWSLSFLVLFFSIAGLPPFVGFFSKIFIIFSIVDAKHFAFGLSILLLSIISTFYYLRFLKIIFFEFKGFTLKDNTSQVIFSDFFFFSNCFLNSLILFFIFYFFINPVYILLTCHQVINGLYFF